MDLAENLKLDLARSSELKWLYRYAIICIQEIFFHLEISFILAINALNIEMETNKLPNVQIPTRK